MWIALVLTVVVTGGTCALALSRGSIQSFLVYLAQSFAMIGLPMAIGIYRLTRRDPDRSTLAAANAAGILAKASILSLPLGLVLGMLFTVYIRQFYL